MDKLLTLGERFERTGEPTAQVVAFHNGRGSLTIEKRAFAESRSPLYDFLQGVQPEAGFTFVLVNALGAYEYYGDNRNGDGFNIRPYGVGELPRCGCKECLKAGLSGWVSEPETLLNHYKTFEKHGGIYTHHVNGDPAKSLGWIQTALWNPYMYRVELLLKVVNSKAPEIIQKIADGNFPAVSMGCRVRWDVCTICGHRAPTRKQYCEHAKFKLRQVLADGRKVGVLNPSPVFFDISFVFRPADPTGWLMQKVANAYVFEGSAELAERRAAFEARRIEIRTRTEKVASELAGSYGPTARQAADAWPSLTPAVKIVLGSVPLSTCLSTLAASGVVLTGAEVTDLMCARQGVELDDRDRAKIAGAAPLIAELLARHPSIQEKLGAEVALNTGAIRPDMLRPIAGWVSKRAGLADYVREQAFSTGSLPFGPGAAYRASEPPRTDAMTLTDPNSGAMYQTTRGAAMRAHHADVKSRIGGSALLGGLYAAGLRSALGNRAGLWVIPAGLGLGWATHSKLREHFPASRFTNVLTDQDVNVPGTTEFAKVSSAPARPTAADVVHAHAFERKYASAARGDVDAIEADAITPGSDPAVPYDLNIAALAEALGAYLTT